MKPSTRLFNLIRSLSPTEHRYFRLFAQRHKKGDNNLHLQLFDAIHQQKTYDEPALKEHFKGTSFGKSLGFPKSNLYDQVLRSLQSYHYESEPPFQFRSAQDKIELLRQRGLYKQGLRILDKALSQAEKLMQASTVLQLLRTKRELLLRVYGSDVLSQIALVAGQEQAWEEIFQSEQLTIRLRDSLLVILQGVRRKTQARDEQHLITIRLELDQLHATKEMSFQAKVSLFQADAYYYHLMDDFGEVHAAYQKAVSLWKENPHQIEAQPERHISTIGAWLNSKALVGDYDNLLLEIQNWRTQSGGKESDLARIFKITYPLELFIYLNSQQFSKAISISKEITAGLKRYDSYLSPNIKITLYYNLVVMHWLGQYPQGGLTWVNRILQMEAGEIRKDIQAITPLVEKILHFELGNTAILESWFRSFDYKRKKKAPISQLENILFELLKSLLQNVASQQSYLQKFLSELDAYAQQGQVSKLGLNEMQIWAHQKLINGNIPAN